MSNSNIGIVSKEDHSFPSGGGEMGELIRNKDWSKTPLGNQDDWPATLKTMVSVMLDNPFGMYIVWGKEYTQIYNDGYRPILGSSKHPQALGISAEITFNEIWDTIGPMFEKVMQGNSIRETDFMVPLNRNGYKEECYFDFAYSPIRDEGGFPGGILVTVIETTNKKKAEDELKDEKERMEYATSAADIATWVYDPQNKTFVGDKLLKEWFGLQQAEPFPLELAMERIIAKDRKALQQGIEQSLQFSCGVIDLEYTIIHPQTDLFRILKVKGKAVFNEDKVAYKLYGILQDVTASTLARRKIEESENNFRKMVLQAPFSIAVLQGPDYVVELVNDRTLQLWRRKREDVMEKPLLQSMPELLSQGIKELLDDVYNSGNTFSATEMEVQIEKNGVAENSFVNFNYQALNNADGIPQRILAIGIDVTDLVNARRNVEESEKRIRSIVENSPFPIAVYTGKEMRIELANQTMLDTWGKGNNVVGKLYADVLPELHNQFIFEQLESVYTTGIPFHARNKKVDLVVDNRLQTFYFNYSFTPLLNVAGEVYGVMNTAADVSDLVNAIQKTEKSEEQLRVALAGGELGTFDYYPLENKLLWSAKTKEFFGLPPNAEVSYESYLSAIHQADTDNSKAISEQRMQLQEDGLYELVYRAIGIEDGKTRWLRSKGKATYNEEGIPVRYTGVIQEITKLKEAEAESQKLTDILEASREFIGLVNTSSEIIYINPAGLKMLGWKSFKGRSITDCVYPGDVELSKNLLSEFYEKGFFNYQIRFINEKTGQPFWLQWNGVAIKDHVTKKVVALATVSPNITERKIAEGALNESEERFRTIADNISQLAWMTDETGWISWYNKRWFEYTGTTFEEMEGWGWKKAHHPDFVDGVENKLRDKISKGEVWEDTFPIRGADGNYRWFLSRAVPIKNKEGRVVRWFGTNTDITERIKAEQELKESESRFRMFADSMPQIVWAADADGNLTYINKAFYQFSGFSPSTNIEEEWIEIIHPDEREETIQEWNKSSQSGREFKFEHRFLRYDGEYRWQLSRAVPIKDAEGKIETWVGTSTDIEEIKELDQQKDHFISIASHELKTPITSIKGYIQILESIYRESEDAFLKKSLAAVDKQIEKLTNLISDLLDLSKLKLGNLHLVKESFNLNELIAEVVEEMKVVKRDYTIDVALQTDTEVFADRERIAQVLINFITNAIKYSPRSKLIQVESFLKDNFFTVVVKDFGIGINKKSHEKIFERFYRVEGKNEKTYPGFGIGLFISSEIIHRHDGTIGVRSTPGKGSEFYFSLPAIIA